MVNKQQLRLLRILTSKYHSDKFLNANDYLFFIKRSRNGVLTEDLLESEELVYIL
jgi:hypothetical protein